MGSNIALDGRNHIAGGVWRICEGSMSPQGIWFEEPVSQLPWRFLYGIRSSGPGTHIAAIRRKDTAEYAQKEHVAGLRDGAISRSRWN